MPGADEEGSVGTIASRAILDDQQRRDVRALLLVGCSRRSAARYAGCTVAAIDEAVRQDPDFAKELDRAEKIVEVDYLSCIRRAARKEQYWRAAAWALERLNPEDFAPRSPDVVTVEQMHALMDQLAQALVEHVPLAAHRKQVLRCVERMLRELPG